MDKVELRMYGIVPYNISPIQQGIQFGHAVVEYGQKIKRIGENKKILHKQYDDWADNWKTFIILNGGTSNHTINRYQYKDEYFLGSMEKHLDSLQMNDVEVATFYEPDLNDMLSAIVFIVDEKVFNKEKYPNFNDWLIQNYGDLVLEKPFKDFSKLMSDSSSKEDQKIWQSWVNFVGGKKNVFLREFLQNFRLA